MEMPVKLKILLVAAIVLLAYGAIGIWVAAGGKSSLLWGVQDKDGKVLIEAKYRRIEATVDGRMFVLALDTPDGDRRMGLADAQGRMLLEPKYTTIEGFTFLPLVKACDEARKCGLAKDDGSWAAAPQFDQLELAGDGPFPFRRGDTYGYVGADGKILAEGQYRLGTPFRDGVAWAQKDGKYVLIDRSFKVVLEPAVPLSQRGTFVGRSALICDTAAKASKGACANGRVIDTSGQAISPKGFVVLARAYSNARKGIAYYEVIREGRRGLMDNTGRIIVKPAFDRVSMRVPTHIKVKIGSNWGLIDMQGKEVLAPKYQELEMDSTSGAVAFQAGGKWGVFSTANNQELLPARYDRLEFTERADRFLVWQGGGASLIDEKGQPVLAQQFADAAPIFAAGAIQYWTATGTAVVDYDGKTLVEPQAGVGAYTIDYSERLLRANDAGARFFVLEPAGHRWARRLSVLYANPFDSESLKSRSVQPFWIAYAIFIAGALLGTWLIWWAGARKAIADAGQVMRFFSLLWVAIMAAAQLSARFSYSRTMDLVIFVTLMLVIPVAYLYLQRHEWNAPVRWLSLALVWPGIVFGLGITVDWMGVQVEDWMFFSVLGVVMAALAGKAGYEAWRERRA
jgi:hypothetical protein